MQLRSLQYTELQDTPQRWELTGITLGQSNLLVGKNASGKSRILNVINSLARHLAGTLPPTSSGTYDAVFLDRDDVLNYHLVFQKDLVLSERYSVNDHVLLTRSEDGSGRIFAEDIDGGKNIRFQTPTTELAAVARRDAIQHKFLEPLYAWGSSVHHYAFGSSLGKDVLAAFTEQGFRKIDTKDTSSVVAIFKHGSDTIGPPFRESIVKDMNGIDYDIEKIGLLLPISVRIESNMPIPLLGLHVKERDLSGDTDQLSMSQGMFRVLSLLIQVTYAQMSGSPACILIDDIGEGLDFDRSCRLIDLLREKAAYSNIQLILATNDRFVMNRVPLEEWSVVRRSGSIVHIMNHHNSAKLFEEFKFTGLSNFSFLEMGFADGFEDAGVVRSEIAEDE